MDTESREGLTNLDNRTNKQPRPAGKMSKITIFSSPKPFSDPHINVIQRNAIQSWKNLGEQVEVLLIGNEPGLKETALELDVQLIPEVERNTQGTPLVPSIFDQAREVGSQEILLYLNADIILLPESLVIINQVHQIEKDYLLVGMCWDVNISWEIDFREDWVAEIKEQTCNEGSLRGITAMDYFIFPKHLYQEIPPFAVGRAGWDNWMIYHAYQKGWKVIDATPSLRVIHQIHDYSHLPEGKPHFDLEESYQNVAISGGMATMFDLLDVDLVFLEGKIRRKKPSIPRILRKMERIVIPNEQKGWRWSMTRFFRQSRKKLAKKW